MDGHQLTRLARAQGRTDIADWIEAETEKARVAREKELAAAVETPLGPLVPGVRYNVTMKGYNNERTRALRDVTIERGGFSPRLVYRTGRTAAHLFSGDVKRITSIEKCGDTIP